MVDPRIFHQRQPGGSQRKILTMDEFNDILEKIEEAKTNPDYKEEIEALRTEIEAEHSHKGIDTPRIHTDDLVDDSDFIKFVSSIPSGEPSHFLERIQLYISGNTVRLYIWDTENSAWKFAPMTAGLSATITVRNSAGDGTCNIVVVDGLITATTC